VIAMTLSDRNGYLVGVEQVFEGDEVILISDQGTLVRTRTDETTLQSRNTQGVTLIRVAEGEKLVGTARVEEPAEPDVVEGENAEGEAVDGALVTGERVDGEAAGSESVPGQTAQSNDDE
jgi:DNA gyrase subunit A